MRWSNNRFLFVGDVSGARDICTMSDLVHDPLYPLANVRDGITVPFSVCNLECVLSDRPDEELDPKPKGIYLKAPTAFATVVRDANFNAVSLANNHACDYGTPGVEDTLAALDSVGIPHFGAGPRSHEPLVVDAAGVRVALFAFLDPRMAERPGVCALDAEAPDRVAAAKGDADVIIVCNHWGHEYQGVNPTQRRYARTLVRAGADLIVGHHPHVTQPPELVDGKLVVYSLGNFAFDSHKGGERTRRGFALEVEVSKGGLTKATLLPHVIDRTYCPRFTGRRVPLPVGRLATR
jgi:poly-gamma-glutamate synthesis protein (capsule biosynthesis protein)